jgi:Tol biopolymer transport system component/DNA-binding winged helix-turn-helix (wHTH) protein
MDMLCYLSAHPGEVLTKEHLLEAVWPDTSVGDDALTRSIVELRKALGDDARSPTYIETIPRRGYRLIAKSTLSREDAPTPIDQYRVAQELNRSQREGVKLTQEAYSGQRAALRVLRPETIPDDASTPRAKRTGTRSWKLRFIISAVLISSGVGVTIWLFFSLPGTREADPTARTRPLTSYPGIEQDPAISPDGNQLAFTWVGESGEVLNLYVKMVDGGEPVLISSGAHHSYTPAWSPDGRRIAFLRQAEGDDGATVKDILEVSALGGDERRLGACSGGIGLSWSPDGKHLAVPHRDEPSGPSSIHLLSRENGTKQKLTTPPLESLGGDHHPRFSPDGKTLAFLRGGAAGSDIFLVSLESGEERPLTFDNPNTQGLDWYPDGGSIVFSSARSGRAGVWSLWKVPSSGGEPKPLNIGEQAEYPVVSRLGRRLAYTRTAVDFNIWRAPGLSARQGAPPPTRFIASTSLDYFPNYSPDGKRICFTSNRSGHLELWVCDSDGKNPKQLTFFNHWLTINGNWSPDGKQIAFMSSKEGNLDIYVVDAEGGFPIQLTTEPSEEGGPEWSRDGGWIYFGSNRTGDFEVWKKRPEGGEAVQVTQNGGTFGVESINGDFLFISKQTPDGGPPGIWRIPVEGGEEVQIHDQAGFGDWMVIDDGICYLNLRAQPKPTFETLDLTTGEVRRVSALEHLPLAWRPSMSPDRQWILYSVDDGLESDIMLVEDF